LATWFCLSITTISKIHISYFCNRYKDMSPDSSGKPRDAESCFSCPEKATSGSSFLDLEKHFLQRGLATNGRIGSKKLNGF
jgi:hypothetical protein